MRRIKTTMHHIWSGETWMAVGGSNGARSEGKSKQGATLPAGSRSRAQWYSKYSIRRSRPKSYSNPLLPTTVSVLLKQVDSLRCRESGISFSLSLSAIRLFCLYIKEPEGGIEFPWRAIKMSVSSRKWSECDIQAGMTAVEKSLALTSPFQKEDSVSLSLSLSLSLWVESRLRWHWSI